LSAAATPFEKHLQMKQTILVLLVIIMALAACNRVACTASGIIPVFVGFSVSDLDTLIIREYERGNNFATPIDTNVVISDKAYGFTSLHDTVFVGQTTFYEGKQYFLADHDWQLYIPAQNITVSFSNFDSPQTHEEYPLISDIGGCTNPIYSFEQNGQRKPLLTDSMNHIIFNNIAFIHR
jgi:hypothetical protein